MAIHGKSLTEKEKTKLCLANIIHNLYMVIMNFVNKMEEKNVPSE